jgi:uncharacterized phage protein (TIGR02220 family)
MKKPNFFYRVNPESVLSELTSVETSEWLQFLLNFLHDLRNDDPTKARTSLAAVIIQEAHNFRELRSKAGKASVKQKANKGQHMFNICSTEVEPVAVAVAVAETKEERPSPEEKDLELHKEILFDLNSKGDFAFRPGETNRKHIRARLREGYTKEDFFHVHTAMIAKWKDDEKMAQYLRPATLYNSEKFEGYRNTKIPESKCVTPEWL